jgi:hypothetical protein
MILTPQEQEKQTRHAFEVNGDRHMDFRDVYAVPDYKAYFKGHTNVKRAFKQIGDNPNAQLQFIMEATDDVVNFPLGVRTFYRAYAADSTIEICHKCSVCMCFIKLILTTLPS